MTDDLTPKWAVELLVRFEQLDAKITAADERNGSHQTWAERNVMDHEKRIRNLEQFRWIATGIALASGLVGAGVQRMIGG